MVWDWSKNKWHAKVIYIVNFNIMIIINEIYVAVNFHWQLYAVLDQLNQCKLSATIPNARHLTWICKYFLYISFLRMFFTQINTSETERKPRVYLCNWSNCGSGRLIIESFSLKISLHFESFISICSCVARVSKSACPLQCIKIWKTKLKIYFQTTRYKIYRKWNPGTSV